MGDIFRFLLYRELLIELNFYLRMYVPYILQQGDILALTIFCHYTLSYLGFSSLGKVFLSEIGDGSVDVLDSWVWYNTSVTRREIDRSRS